MWHSLGLTLDHVPVSHSTTQHEALPHPLHTSTIGLASVSTGMSQIDTSCNHALCRILTHRDTHQTPMDSALCAKIHRCWGRLSNSVTWMTNAPSTLESDPCMLCAVRRTCFFWGSSCRLNRGSERTMLGLPVISWISHSLANCIYMYPVRPI